MMDSGKAAARAALSAPEDIGLPEDMEPAVPSAPAPADPLPDCAQLPLNDFGNGSRYIRHFGEDVIWVPRMGWYVWTGSVWARDQDEIHVRRRAQQMGALIEQEIPHILLEDWQMKVLADGEALKRRAVELERIIEAGDEDAPAAREELAQLDGKLARVRGIEKIMSGVRKDHHGWAKTSGNSGRMDAMIKEASVGLAKAHELLDAAPLDVCCLSHVLRFRVERIGTAPDAPKRAWIEAIGHERQQLMSKQMPVTYDPAAQAPAFDEFLRRILPDPDIRAFIQRWFGLSMTGLTWEQKLVFLFGMGANGKSVLVDLIAKIMGDYAATARIETLTGEGRRDGAAATPDLIPLMGARMVRAAEPEEGAKFREAMIKELTGGEPINVRPNFGEFISSLPVFKLTISGNHKPEIRGQDDGIWRRFLLVPFEVTIPPNERDPDLGAKLFEERSGILNWLIEGLMNYLENGLQPPAAVTMATDEYREESDPLGHFLDVACVVSGDSADSEYVRDLVQGFQYWQEEQGGTAWRPGTIQRKLKDKMRRWVSPSTGKKFTERKSNGVMRYDGIRFGDLFGARFRGAARDSHGRPIVGKTADDDAIYGERRRGQVSDFDTDF